MLQRRHEKIIYENDKGENVEITYSFPYFLQQLLGADGTSTDITSTKGVVQDGVSINNVSLQPRGLQIIGYIKEKDKSLLARRRARLMQVFNPKIKGILQYEYGNVKKQIRVQVESAPYFAKAFNVFNVLNFTIDLIAPNPYWQDISESKTDISTETGNIEFPLEIPTEGLELSIRTISFITNIYNQGDVDTPIKVTLKAVGTVVNPVIENLDTGEYIRVKRTLAEGDTLEINTAFGNKRVEIIKPDGSRENVFHYIDYKSTFFSLSDGDNTIKYDAEVGENNLDVSIYYTPNYLGI